VEKYTKGALIPFVKNSKLVNCTEITTYHKTTAFCAEFFPWIQGAPDYTSAILAKIRNVRNEYVHRSGVTVKLEGEKVKELQKNSSLASLRTTLIKIVDCVKMTFATNAITNTMQGVVQKRLPSAATIKCNGKVIMLDNSIFSKYSSYLNEGNELTFIVKLNKLLDFIV
jgi:hypothetical protein